MRVAVAAGAIALALVGAAYWSGCQAPIDVVAETEQRHGIDLDSRLIATNGTHLHVVQAGPDDGPPVLLLHGFPEFWWGWHEQIARLAAAGFRVIAPDQRGYNDSDKPRDVAAYGIDLLEADILGLMDALGHRQVFLAGHDWGGAIAWRLAIDHPERVRALVMFNAPHPQASIDARQGPEKSETITWFRTFFQLPWLPEIAARAGNWWLLGKNLRDTSRAGTFPERDLDYYRSAWDRDGAMGAMINWYRASFRDPRPVSGDATVYVPTRIVWGMRDRFFEPRLAALSVRHCSDATLVELPDAGHWLLHEEPETTSRQMIELFSAPASDTPSAG